jgi:hypothetical protein
MRLNKTIARQFLAVLGCALIAAGGCGGNWNLPAQYERSTQLTAPLATGKHFEVETHNGGIAVSGAETTECKVDALIRVRAKTAEEAKQISEEEVKVELVSAENGLLVDITRPPQDSRRYSLSIDFDVTLPEETSLKLKSHNGELIVSTITGEVQGTTHNGGISGVEINGNVEFYTHNGKIEVRDGTGDQVLTTHNNGVYVQNIEGAVTAKTHNGKIEVKNVPGDLELNTANSAILGEDIKGNVRGETHNGKIYIVYAKDAPAVREVWLKTYNGGIEFCGPEALSAEVEAKTRNGSIHLDKPVEVVGEVKKHLRGTIGSGQGKLYLETYNGSITIK